MSIKEALEKTQLSGYGTLMPRGELDNKIDSIYVEQGMRILKDAGGEKILRELADIVKPDFPDVVLLEVSSRLPRGVGLALEWDFKTLGPFKTSIKHPSFKTEKGDVLLTAKTIAILADPLTEQIAARNSSHYNLVINKEEWKFKPEILENAVVVLCRSMDANTRTVASRGKKGAILIQ